VRILLDYRPALRQRTGVGEYVHELARELAAMTTGTADEITLFSASWKDRLSPKVIPGVGTLDRKIPVRLLNLAWHRFEWPPIETVAGTTFDVVQSLHPLLVPSERAAQIVTVADLDFLDHPERTRAEIRRDYPALAASHAMRADRVVTISRATAGDVEHRLGVPASKISVCYPGRPDWRARDAEPNAASACVLFLGTLEPRKNLAMLLDAYERLLAQMPAAPPLVLAGGTTPDSAAIVARAGAPPLAGHVTVTGYVEAAGREALYRRALVFVMPSHTEGFGMPALEAMTVGVPVVAANRGALPEVVGDAGRLIDPADAGALAATLADLLGDRAARLEMREAGLAQSRRFEWRDAARELRAAWALAVEARQRRHG
jgi:glycosyltransferase involved in cell wall biosynthesis